MFDGDALRDALEAPTVKWNGQTYDGRLLSSHEFSPLHERLISLPEDAPYTAAVTLLEDAYRECGLPPEIVCEFSVAVLNAAIVDFFGCQARAGTPVK